MTGDTVGLLLRLVLSLAAVIGLMWLAARMLRGQLRGSNGGVLEVVARQQLGRGSSVAVIRVADQAMLVGVTESKITLLAETDLAAVEAAQAAAETERTPVHSAVGGSAADSLQAIDGLSGSIVSPATWKQAVNVLRDRTARRG